MVKLFNFRPLYHQEQCPVRLHVLSEAPCDEAATFIPPGAMSAYVTSHVPEALHVLSEAPCYWIRSSQRSLKSENSLTHPAFIP